MFRPDPSAVALTIATLVAATSAVAQPSASVQTRDFVTAAAQSDHFEILEAQVAGAQSQNPAVLAFAREMIQDHIQTSSALLRATAASGMKPPPPGLGGDQQKLLAALQGLTGQAFDKLYAHQQVLAHTEALTVEQSYARQGPDRNVARAAREAVPMISRHLAMAERLGTDLGDH